MSKPKHLGPEYGAQFGDGSVVAAYRYRPPYPPGVFAILADLIGDGPRAILDAGCGSGDLAIPLARFALRVDAVDPSRAMLTAARARPGGDSARLRWITGSMEEVSLAPPYALVTAGESLHWMDWPVVLRRFREVLEPRGYVAMVERVEQSNPWWPELLRLINVYSTNRDFQPYNLVDELERRGLFRTAGAERTEPVPFEQSIDDYIESVHSRNGFSRDRMTPDTAAAFDDGVKALLQRYSSDGFIRFDNAASVVWGEPAS